MNHRIIASVLMLFLVALVSPAFAHGANIGISGRASSTPVGVRAGIRAEIETRRASTTERRQNMMENRQERVASSTERREEVRNNIEQRRASSTERRVEFQQNIAKRTVEHVAKVMLATIERLEKIIVRVESRIDKIQERGGDTTEAEGFIVLAEENLADAKIAVEAFASLDLSGSTASENFETIRAAAAEARELIRAARENLRNAVKSLKSITVSAEVEGSLETE
ncbi:MAG: hypothetical protein WAX80_03495 [Minisyncoccia bacterium]